MLQRPHFLPKDSPSSVAQTAHCVRIIFARGQPAMPKPRRLLALFASVLQPLASAAAGLQTYVPLCARTFSGDDLCRPLLPVAAATRSHVAAAARPSPKTRPLALGTSKTPSPPPLYKKKGSQQSLTNHAPRLVDADGLDQRHRKARRPQ